MGRFSRIDTIRERTNFRKTMANTIIAEKTVAEKLLKLKEKLKQDLVFYDSISTSDEKLKFIKDNNYSMRTYHKNDFGEVLIVENDSNKQAKVAVLYRGVGQEKFSIVAKNKCISGDFSFENKDNVLHMHIKNIEIISEITPVNGMENVCIFDSPRKLGMNLRKVLGIKNV